MCIRLWVVEADKKTARSFWGRAKLSGQLRRKRFTTIF